MTAAAPRPTYVALLGVAGHGIDALVDALGGDDEREAHGVRAVTVRTADRRFRVVHGNDHLDALQVLFLQEPVPHAAVPVVSTEIGVTVGLREQLFVASRLGVPVPAAVLTGGGAAFEFVERSLRMRLAEYGYPADDVPVLPAEAKGVLFAALNTVPAAADGPFLQAIEAVYHPDDRPAGFGSVERGEARVGDPVDLVGLRAEAFRTRIVQVESMGLAFDAEDGIGFVLEGVGPGELQVGQMIAAPGTVRAATTFEAVVHLRPDDRDGRAVALKCGYAGRLRLRNRDWSPQWTVLGDDAAIPAGEVGGVRVELSPDEALAVYPGLAFGVREGGRTVGWGRVTRVVG